MMISHPVLLGLLWSLLIHSMSGRSQVSSQETNQVYAYSYHFQHNGTTNSKDILRTVLGVDPDFGIETPGGQSIIKTFSSPNIRGFFTKGILPAGPQHFNSGFGSRFNTNSAIDDIKKVVEANLQPPPNIANGLLQPISPDISNRFSDNFNNVNDIGLNFQKQNDFPKIPPPPPSVPFQNRDNFPNAPRIPPINLNSNFPKIPDPIINNHGISRVENFSRNTPDGGKIEGKIETFSYNPPPVTNSNSNFQENSQGFRRNENFVNNNQEVTGHRTQSYFKQHFRTITPNIESNSLFQNNENKRIDNNNNNNNNNNNVGNGNNNQWWNVLNVLGHNNNNNNNNNNNVRNNGNLGRQVERNINEIKNNLNNGLNRQFGSRLSNFNKIQNIQPNQIEKIEPRKHLSTGHNNANRNFNNHFNGHNAFQNQQIRNIPLNNRMDSNQAHTNYQNNNVFTNVQSNNNGLNNVNNHHNNNPANFNNNARANHNSNNVLSNQNNINNQFKNDDTTKKVLNIINDVNAQLNNLDNNAVGKNNNNFRLTWDDDVPQIFNHNNDWSRRQSSGNGRPFSNAHSGPLNNQPVPKPIEVLKSTIDSLVGGREFSAPDIGNQGGNYRNVGGGGMEKFFNMERVVEGPNSFSRNQRRGFERNFHVNSNSGYERNNQWATNNLRRLDAQSSRDAFSKDFIDVFRDDY